MKPVHLVLISTLSGGFGGAAVLLLARRYVPLDPVVSGADEVHKEVGPVQRVEQGQHERLRSIDDQLRQVKSRLDELAMNKPVPTVAHPIQEDTLLEHVADAVELEHQRTLDREIALRQQADVRALEKFAEQVSVPSEKRRALQEIFFEATQRHLELIDQGNRALRPWDEVRSEMDDSWAAGSDSVRELLGEEEYALLAAIAAKHGTAMVLRQERQGPEGGTGLPEAHPILEPLLP